MICELCGKAEASITIKQVSENGHVVVHEICEACAKKFNLDFSGTYFGDVAKIFEAIDKKNKNSDNNLICPSCGTKLSDMLRYNHIGCSDCVFYFKSSFKKIINQKADCTIYKGKKPKVFNIINRPTVNETLRNLKQKLRQAVKIENYELAAYFRDKIKELEDGHG